MSDSIEKETKYRMIGEEWVHDDPLEYAACKLSVLLDCFFERDDLRDVEKEQVAIARRIIIDVQAVVNRRVAAEQEERIDKARGEDRSHEGK